MFRLTPLTFADQIDLLKSRFLFRSNASCFGEKPDFLNDSYLSRSRFLMEVSVFLVSSCSTRMGLSGSIGYPIPSTINHHCPSFSHVSWNMIYIYIYLYIYISIYLSICLFMNLSISIYIYILILIFIFQHTHTRI